MPAPLEDCTFVGVAAKVRVEGQGPAVLTDQAPFGAPHAASVELHGARIGESGAFTKDFDPAPMGLLPFNMNPKGVRFDVTYAFGPPLRVEMTEGGAEGQYRGPECPEWCALSWSGETKTAVAHRADDETIPLSGHFRLEEGTLERVTLKGASGTLTCKGESDEVTGKDWVWHRGERATLSLKPLELSPSGITVRVKNESRPRRRFDGHTRIENIASALEVG